MKFIFSGKQGKYMAFISPEDAATVRERFEKEMVKDVTLTLFVEDETGAAGCEYCDETRDLLEEFAGLSGKLKLVVHKYPSDREAAVKYGIDKVPALVLEQDKDVGIRFYGIPAGYEFATLIEDTISLSRGETKLAASVLDQVRQITQDVTIRVFVTPT